MKMIDKKTWPKYFELMFKGEKNVDIRLADFDIAPGDEIRFNEYDPIKDQYTGRAIIRKVTQVNHVYLTDFHSIEEIHEKGHLIIEVEEKDYSEVIK